MIVVSDDEDEVEEIKESKKVKKQQVKIKNIPIVLNHEDETSDSEDDVCVVGQVSRFKKCPKGAIIGSFRSYGNMSWQMCNIKKRRRPDSTVVRSCSMRRPHCASTSFHPFCNSTVIRRLFQMEEVIRLEERLKYIQLLESIFKGISIQNISSSLLRHHVRDVSPHTSPKQKTSPKTKLPNVECIDLTSDSENDVVELSQELKPSEVNDIEELPHDTDNIIDLEEEPKCVDTVSYSPSLKTSLEIECTCPTTSRQSKNQFRTKSIGSRPVDTVHGFDIESKHETEHANDSKGNLEERMLQQMIINDDIASVIDVDNDKEASKEEEEQPLEEDKADESFPEITYEMQVLVHRAFTSRSSKVVVEAFNIPIHGRDIHTLKGSSWLNDEIINFYMCLLMERGKLRSYPSVYCFNTFFYVKLLESGHASLKRWTQKVDIFSYELIIVPVHLKVHWCLACVNFIEKRIEYYDSMGGMNDDCGKTLLKYLEEEYFHKKDEIFNISGWQLVNMEGIPEQLNGSDCGVFVCTYAEYICRLAKLTFTQRNMPYFRVKMAYEILTKKLLL